MEHTREIKRGEMYYANLCPVVGSEQGGIRPVLILQNDRNNRHSPTTIVAAMTGQKKKRQRTHVTVSGCGLAKTTLVLLEQVRTIDKSRLRDYIGTLSCGGASVGLTTARNTAPTRRLSRKASCKRLWLRASGRWSWTKAVRRRWNP